MSKLDLKPLLGAIDKNNINYYDGLTDEHKAEFSPWVIMRFASACQNHPEHYLMMVNDFVNQDFSELSKHPELFWKLLAVCGAGYNQYHPWIAPSKKGKKNNKEGFVSALYPHYRKDEIKLFLKVYSDEELKNMAKDNGYSDEEIKEIFK